FVDVVFPAFLFIVGMSIPFGIGRRLQQGQSLWRVWLHILGRTGGLLMIGVFMVNQEEISERGVLSSSLLALLMYAGVMLIWNAPLREWRGARLLSWGMRVLGVVLLVALAMLYRGKEEQPTFIQLRPHWWGILGLIGWAYLVACIAYMLQRRQLAG